MLRPNHCSNQAVRVGVKIRVEHAACRKSLDHAQLLNPEQNQRGPDVIEKLNCNEQDPQRDFVSFRSARESNAVMSDKHFRFNCRGVCAKRLSLGARRGERRYNRRATDDLAVRLLIGKQTASPAERLLVGHC